jgi:hypothetical protein
MKIFKGTIESYGIKDDIRYITVALEDVSTRRILTDPDIRTGSKVTLRIDQTYPDIEIPKGYELCAYDKATHYISPDLPDSVQELCGGYIGEAMYEDSADNVFLRKLKNAKRSAKA